MTSYNFAVATFQDLFQSRITNYRFDLITADELTVAMQHSYLAQSETKPTIVSRILKSLVKERQLWQLQTIAHCDETGEDVLIDGRHRAEAELQLIRDYGVNAKGEIVLRTSANSTDLDAIDEQLMVIRCNVKTRVDLVALLQSANESRSMTSAEKMEGKLYAHTLTPLASLKRSLGLAINDELSHITPQASLALASKIAGLVGRKFQHVSKDQIVTLASFVREVYDDVEETLDENFSRKGYVQLSEACETFEAPDVVIDKDGDEIENATWIQWFTEEIVVPVAVKKTKATEATARAEAAESQVQQLEAKLNALMRAQQG